MASPVKPPSPRPTSRPCAAHPPPRRATTCCWSAPVPLVVVQAAPSPPVRLYRATSQHPVPRLFTSGWRKFMAAAVVSLCDPQRCGSRLLFLTPARFRDDGKVNRKAAVAAPVQCSSNARIPLIDSEKENERYKNQ